MTSTPAEILRALVWRFKAEFNNDETKYPPELRRAVAWLAEQDKAAASQPAPRRNAIPCTCHYAEPRDCAYHGELLKASQPEAGRWYALDRGIYRRDKLGRIAFGAFEDVEEIVSLLNAAEARRTDGLSHADLVTACKNIGFDLECGGCAANFFTGTGAISHDEGCFTHSQVLAQSR